MLVYNVVEFTATISLGGEMRILVVDDEPSVLDLFKSYLGGLKGYEVAIACNAAEGLEVFRSFKPDKVFSDWNMPGGGGSALIIGMTAEDFDLQNVAVVTGYGVSDEDALANINQALQLQIGAAFLKPLNLRLILEFVQK